MGRKNPRVKKSRQEYQLSQLSSKVYSSPTIVSALGRSITYLLSLLERSYFVLDTESHLVHFFKKNNQTKPYQTLSLQYGVVDQEEPSSQEKALISFKFQFMQSNGKKKKGK